MKIFFFAQIDCQNISLDTSGRRKFSACGRALSHGTVNIMVT